MATLKVQDNGNAPSNAKVGDHIVTAGGTYQVLDSSQYQGKSPEELASAGVGYNPSSGLYSKKISDVTNFTGNAQSTTPQLSLRTSDTARQWANTQNQKVSADLDSAYYQNRQDAYNSYMDAITRQNQQANDVNASYLDNISKLYNNTYQNNNAVLERMASRGLTSSGLGNAMQVSALADASKKNADLRFQRNRDLNNIETEMNNLTNQYNVNLDTLAKKLRSDKISALSQNEIAFLEQVMAIEEYNANAENQALTIQQQQAYEAEQALLNREFQAYQTAVNNQHEMDMLLKQIEAGSFSGGGGYSRGGYGRGYRRYGSGGYYGYGSGSGSGDWNNAEALAAAYWNGNSNNINSKEAQAIDANVADRNYVGVVALQHANKTRQRNEIDKKNGKATSKQKANYTVKNGKVVQKNSKGIKGTAVSKIKSVIG